MSFFEIIDLIHIQIQIYESIFRNINHYNKSDLNSIIDSLDKFVSLLLQNIAILKSIQNNMEQHLMNKPANFSIAED